MREAAVRKQWVGELAALRIHDVCVAAARCGPGIGGLADRRYCRSTCRRDGAPICAMLLAQYPQRYPCAVVPASTNADSRQSVLTIPGRITARSSSASARAISSNGPGTGARPATMSHLTGRGIRGSFASDLSSLRRRRMCLPNRGRDILSA